MIRLEFVGTTVDGTTFFHHEGDALVELRVRFPVREDSPVIHPTLNGKALDPIGQARTRAQDKTYLTLEYEIQGEGEVVVFSWMNLQATAPTRIAFGVQEMDYALRITNIQDSTPKPLPWVIDDEFFPFEGEEKTLIVHGEAPPDTTPDPPGDPGDTGDSGGDPEGADRSPQDIRPPLAEGGRREAREDDPGASLPLVEGEDEPERV